MTKRKRIKRLSKEQREAAWKPIESNCGLGWTSKYGAPADPLEFERGNPDNSFDPWDHYAIIAWQSGFMDENEEDCGGKEEGVDMKLQADGGTKI